MMALISGDDVYEVDKILKKRFHPTKGVEYLVKWKNFPSSANTWEPPHNFSSDLIDAYEYKRRKGQQQQQQQQQQPQKQQSQQQQQKQPNHNNQRQQLHQSTSHSQPPSNPQQLAVFNPVGTNLPDHLPIVREVFYEPALTKEPIIVTDVTAQDCTITISECRTSAGFFSA